MSEKTAIAYLKSVKSSPLKVMKVAHGVRNMPVSRALDVLKFSKLKLSPIVRSLIYSAMSNAENNHDMDVDNLYIKRIDIGKAFTLKRFHTRGRGKSSRILKAYSNIRVVLAEKEEEVKKDIKKEKASDKVEVKKNTVKGDKKQVKIEVDKTSKVQKDSTKADLKENNTKGE